MVIASGAATRRHSAAATDGSSQRRWPLLLVRLTVVILGGYAAAAGLVAGFSAVLPHAGMIRSEAVVLSSMLGFVAYLAILLWGFADRSLWRVSLGLAVAGGAGFGLAALISAGG